MTRPGHSVGGANLNLMRTMRNSLALRIPLHRPRPHKIAALERQIEAALAADDAESAAQSN